MGVNSSGGIRFKDCFITIDEINPDASFSPNNPLMNIGRNIENQQGAVQPGTGGGVGIDNFVVRYNEIPYPSAGVSGEMWTTVSINAESAYGLPVEARIRGITLILPRTNVTGPNGASDGYVVNRNGNVGGTTIVQGVNATTLDSGTKLLNVSETQP